MILESGEHWIASQNVESITRPWSEPGQLILTNLRLVFEGSFYQPGVGSVPRTLLDLRLGQILNVVAAPGQLNRNVLRVEAGGQFVYTFVMPNAPDWAHSIVQARAKAPPVPSGYVGQGPVVVSVQAPAAPKIMMHCRNCGALYDATKGRCDKCGAPPT